MDRFDSFVYFLNQYYNSKDKHAILKPYNTVNKDLLIKYLDEFEDVFDYCAKVYFITDRFFIQELIQHGGKPMDSGHRVVEYMDLACRYWKLKEEVYTRRISENNFTKTRFTILIL